MVALVHHQLTWMPEWGLAREGSTGHLVHRTSFSAVCLSEYNWFNGSHSIRGRSGCSIVSSCNITAVASRNVEWWHSHTLCAQLWGVLKGRASCKNRWLILLTFISDPHLKTWEFPLNVCLRKSVKTSFTLSSTQHFGTSPGREERDIQAPHSGGPEEWWEREIFLGIWPWNGAFFFFLKEKFGPNYGSTIFCDQLWKWRMKHLFYLSSASNYTRVFN